MFKRKQKIATKLEALKLQARMFLREHEFPTDPAHEKLFAAFIQHLPEHQDYFIPSELAACMRKAQANESAFFLMYPEKHEQHLKDLQKIKDKEDADAAQAIASPVGKEA